MHLREIFNAGSFDDSMISYEWVNATYFKHSTKLKDINKNLSLYQNQEMYLLIKDDSVIIGLLGVSNKTILGIEYNQVDIIYVFPKYRNTSAIKWLIFSVKEESKYQLIADGAIFDKGNELINSLIKYNIMKVSILDKDTGDISIFDKPITDLSKCYIFEQFNCGYYTQPFGETGPNIWYNFFD